MGPDTPILHTKFQGNQSIGTGEGFLNDFTIYGHGSHICHVTKLIFINLNFLVPKSYRLEYFLKTSFDFFSYKAYGTKVDLGLK